MKTAPKGLHKINVKKIRVFPVKKENLFEVALRPSLFSFREKDCIFSLFYAGLDFFGSFFYQEKNELSQVFKLSST